MPGILHKTRAAGTKINTSAVWAEAHEVEGSAIGTTEIADGSVTAAKLASDARFYRFVKSGTSPITFLHNMPAEPTGVVATPRALQPYAWSYDKNATQIKIYHNAVGSLTFSIVAWI